MRFYHATSRPAHEKPHQGSAGEATSLTRSLTAARGRFIVACGPPSSIPAAKPSEVRPMRPAILKTCARCGAAFIRQHSGARYCSAHCYSMSRREYKSRWIRERRAAGLLPKSQLKQPSAVDRTVGDWRRARYRRRSKTGCGLIVSYHHANGRYRVDHYLSIGELSYVAIRLHGGAETISRHSTLEEAKRACERHRGKPARRSNGQRFNELGDPIISANTAGRKTPDEPSVPPV